MTSNINETQIQAETHTEHPVTIISPPKPITEQNNADEIQTCLICYNDFPPSGVWTPLNCQHNFCTNCFKEHIESKMNSFQVLNIHCPQEGCQEIFTDPQIQKILGDTEYNRYQELVLKKMAYKNSTARVCPAPGCARPLTGLDDIDGNITCICGTQVCSKCMSFSHPGKSCLQSVDPEFELYAQDHDIRYCIMCKTPVSRVEGCLHMTCCVCDYEWCWSCGKQYDPKHVCKGVWNPSAPSIYENKTKAQKIASSIKKGLIFVVKGIVNIFIILPVVLVVGLIFWPFEFLMENHRRVRRRGGRAPGLCKVFGLVMLSGLIGILLLPFVVTGGTILLLCSLPKIIIRIKRRREAMRKNKQPKRWMLGNPGDFRYTEVARPTVPAPQDLQPISLLENLTVILEERMPELAAIRRIQSFPTLPQPQGDLEDPRQELHQSAIQLTTPKLLEDFKNKKSQSLYIEHIEPLFDVGPQGVLSVPPLIPIKIASNEDNNDIDDSLPLNLSAAFSGGAKQEEKGVQEEKDVSVELDHKINIDNKNIIENEDKILWDNQPVVQEIRIDDDEKRGIEDDDKLFDV